jgi:hypothetical protein
VLDWLWLIGKGWWFRLLRVGQLDFVRSLFFPALSRSTTFTYPPRVSLGS